MIHKLLTNAVVGLFVLICVNAQAQTLKVGYTRIDYILSQTPEAKVITAQLTTQKDQAVSELGRMQKELQDKYAAYQKNAAQLSEVIRKDRETELQSLQTRIQEFNAKADESLQNKYKQLITPVLTKVQGMIDQVAKENGYTYVINAGSGNSTDVLFASEENNITNLVLKKLGITPGQNIEKPATKSPATSAKTPVGPAKTTVPKKK